MFFFQIPRLPEYLLGRKDSIAIKDAILNSSRARGNFSAEVLEVYRRNANQPGAMTAMINYYRALLRFRPKPWVDGFPLIETPTLMIWGEEDAFLGKETTYGTGDFVKDLTIRYLPGVSHWVQQEAPDAVNAMISAFLAGETVPEVEWVLQLRQKVGDG